MRDLVLALVLGGLAAAVLYRVRSTAPKEALGTPRAAVREVVRFGE